MIVPIAPSLRPPVLLHKYNLVAPLTLKICGEAAFSRIGVNDKTAAAHRRLEAGAAFFGLSPEEEQILGIPSLKDSGTKASGGLRPLPIARSREHFVPTCSTTSACRRQGLGLGSSATHTQRIKSCESTSCDEPFERSPALLPAPGHGIRNGGTSLAGAGRHAVDAHSLVPLNSGGPQAPAAGAARILQEVSRVHGPFGVTAQ